MEVSLPHGPISSVASAWVDMEAALARASSAVIDNRVRKEVDGSWFRGVLELTEEDGVLCRASSAAHDEVGSHIGENECLSSSGLPRV